jgi:hypothetical protein
LLKPQVVANQEVRWEKPDDQWIKVNVDATFSAEFRTGSWVAVVRDNQGKTIASAWGKIEYCQSAQMGEAISCYEGLKLALSVSCKNVMVETDCVSLLKVFDPGGGDRSPSSIIGQDFHRLIPMGTVIKLKYTNRKANRLAHEIARFACKELCSGVMLGQVPACVSELARQECMNNVMPN